MKDAHMQSQQSSTARFTTLNNNKNLRKPNFLCVVILFDCWRSAGSARGICRLSCAALTRRFAGGVSALAPLGRVTLCAKRCSATPSSLGCESGGGGGVSGRSRSRRVQARWLATVVWMRIEPLGVDFDICDSEDGSWPRLRILARPIRRFAGMGWGSVSSTASGSARR